MEELSDWDKVGDALKLVFAPDHPVYESWRNVGLELDRLYEGQESFRCAAEAMQQTLDAERGESDD